MSLLNTQNGYSQLASANIMLRIDADETAPSLHQATYYNWPQIDRPFCASNRAILYTAMFVMPASGFLYVMAGGYGVNLFRVPDLANPIDEHALLAIAQSGHTSLAATLSY